ncbi:cellulase family glycosylhydrolase [Xanthobacter variabilis]|uniref:cellulase family glycosylhydrolase n=1 Tax=Xanthobacter variabilis TaxID=3119932 RepID=UPI00372CC81B
MNDDTNSTDTISFSVRDNWTAGFVGDMTLTAQAALDGWTVAFDAPFEISNIWNAEIVSHVGDHYVIRNAAWNGTVAANGAVSFGFQASPGGGSATVSDFVINGTAVDGGGDPTPQLPSLAIADAQVAEGDDGASYLTFTVSLSAASTSDISVHFATTDGSATAGSDYIAQSGSLTFAAGETTKTIRVAVNGDSVVEGHETLSVTLSAPTGATLADATATGTILNDDAAPPAVLPTVSVSGTTVVEGNPGTGSGDAADGWFSTSGNQIVDADGNAAKIAGVNWFGFEGSNNSPNGLWTRSYTDMMDQMKELGFNTIRLPFSSDMLHSTTASGIDYSQNPDLQGLSPLEIMDKIVEYADEIGMKIILDHHRSSAGAGTSENGLWYDSAHSEAQWISDWQMLAERYADNSAVIGADLHNEPYNGTWGGGGANDWAAAAERAGNAIGEVNANWLIFVEGVGTYEGESYWWGGNLMGVRDRPIALEVDNKLVYSAHDYGNSVYAQPWFQSSDFAADLPEKFREMWGYIYEENIAPVYIGEFGTKLEDPKDAPWLEALTSYLSGDFNNDGTIDLPAGAEGISWTYWSWNPNSGDTGGILADDWRTVHTEKLAYLEPIEFDLGDGSGSGDVGSGDANAALFVISLSEAASETVTVDYHTVAGTADSSDFTASSGTVTFAAGETTKVVRIPVTADTAVEGNEHFSLVLTDADGAVIGIAEGVATIADDDGAGPTVPSLSIADAQVAEGDAGAAGTLAFTVSLSSASDQAITVSYHTAGGTATEGVDYTGMDGTFTIAAGETQATIHVPVIGDSTVEANERFTVVLTGATGATIADGSATGTIVNDDAVARTGDQLAFTVNDNWGAGFVGSMTLTPEADLNGWTVAFDADFDISNIWNAEIVSHVGDHYVIRNAAWNSDVDAGSPVTFGFQASPGGAEAVASGLTVNGAAIASEASLAATSAELANDVLLTAALSHLSTSDTAFTADVTLHNGGEATAGWSVEIDTPFEITSVSGAEILSHTADGYVLGHTDGNGVIGANDDLTFSIAGTGRFDASQFGILV